MSEDNGDRENFLARWSRRKREQGTESDSAPDSAPDTQLSAPNAQENDAFADFDFDSLNFASDYRRFMASAVPEEVRSKALRKLWTSTDIIAKADDLDDYLEDFREEAMALPAEMVRSAYRIGRGFVEDKQDADEADEQLSAPKHADSQTGTASATAKVDNRDKIAACESKASVTVPADADEPPDRQAAIVKLDISFEAIEHRSGSSS